MDRSKPEICSCDESLALRAKLAKATSLLVDVAHVMLNLHAGYNFDKSTEQDIDQWTADIKAWLAATGAPL